LCIGGGGENVRVEVALGEGGYVVCPPPEFPGFVRVWVELGVLLGVTERLARPRVVERYEVFRIVSRSGGRCGWCTGPFFALLGSGGAGSWVGLGCLLWEGGRCRGGRDRG